MATKPGHQNNAAATLVPVTVLPSRPSFSNFFASSVAAINWLQDKSNNPAKHILRKGKKRITRKLRLEVWNKEYGSNIDEGICTIKNCTIKYKKNSNDWDSGHIISEFNGGETTLNNLRPLCKQCNNCMGRVNWDIYEN